MVPQFVRDLVGLKTNQGFIPSLDDSLWKLNDGSLGGGKRHSFYEIANIIEKHWEEL